DYMKKNPGKFNFANSGTWGAADFPMRMMAKAAGVEYNNIPFDGGGPATLAVLGGHADATFSFTAQLMPQVTAGKLRPLAVTGPSRIRELPQTPTLQEEGVDVVFPMWRAGVGVTDRNREESRRGILPALARRPPRRALAPPSRPRAARSRCGRRAGRHPHGTGDRAGGRARRLHGDARMGRLSDRHVPPRALHGEGHAPAALAARARRLAARRRRLVSALRRVAEGAAAAGLMEILSLLGSGFAIALTP